MALNILFKVDVPDGAECSFHGCKPNSQNSDFDQQDYQRAVHFEEFTQCLRDDKGNPTGIIEHPVKVWKEVDIDTPFFKECCHRRLLIPKVVFHFFHNLKGDSEPINHVTLELEQAIVLSDKLILHDTTQASTQEKPYVEELLFSAQILRWKYKRDQDPLAGDQGTEFNVP